MSEHHKSEEPISKEELEPYIGRWVAVAGGRIAGVGKTALAAERLGRRNRLREKLAVYYVESPGGASLDLPDLLEALAPILRQNDQPVYLVGGAVRDMLLNRTSHDLDFAVAERAIDLAFKIANRLGAPAFVLDHERDTGRVVLQEEGITLDFAGFRGRDIGDDLVDRDFTINAIALPIGARSATSLIDPCSGQGDLTAQVIRQANDQSISDDPVRALRAIRLALELGFSIEAKTSSRVRDQASALESVSVERVRDELVTMMQGDKPHEAVRALNGHGLLLNVLPEIAKLKAVEQSAPHREAVLDHIISTLAVLREIELAIYDVGQRRGKAMVQMVQKLDKYKLQLRQHLDRELQGSINGRLLLRLGALFHDVGKSLTATEDDDHRIRFLGHEGVGSRLAARRLRKLRFSNEAIDLVSTIVFGHMWPLSLANNEHLSRRAIYRYFRRSGPAGLDIGLLSVADHVATNGGIGDEVTWERQLSVVDRLFDHYFNHYTETVRPVPLIDGRQLMMAIDLAPGPEVGRLLELIREAQAAGRVNSAEEAIALAAKEKKQPR